jgi:hypothetical protein
MDQKCRFFWANLDAQNCGINKLIIIESVIQTLRRPVADKGGLELLLIACQNSSRSNSLETFAGRFHCPQSSDDLIPRD